MPRRWRSGTACNLTLWAGLRNTAPLALVCEFAAQVSAVDRLRAAQRVSLAKLDTLFASLQHRVFW
jgi:hypothetical protein